MTKERKQTRKLTIEIVDAEKIFAEFPAFKREDFTKTVLDESKLRSTIRPIVNALYEANKQVPGVNAYYADEKAAAEALAAKTSDGAAPAVGADGGANG